MKNELKLISRLAQNDIKSRYSSSFFGIIWAFVMPLITILVFWYVFQLGFKNLPVSNAPYILWFSAAYVPWIFFTDVITYGSNSFIEYSYLVKKIKFKIIYIPLIKLISAIFVHGFFILFLFFMFVLYRYPITVYSIQILYYSFALSVLALGLNYLFASVTVFFRDASSMINIIIQIGFWVTPILWDEKSMVDKRVIRVLSLNPIHYVINGYRDSLIYCKGFWDNPAETAYFWSFSLILFVLGITVFKRLSPFFADEV